MTLRRHWNNRKYDSGKLKFPHTLKNFSENHPQFGHMNSKISPALSFKKKKA